MSGYVKELCVSSSSKNGYTVQLAVKIIMVGGKGVHDSPCRGWCWASHMHKNDTSSQMSLQYVLCHLFNVVIIFGTLAENMGTCVLLWYELKRGMATQNDNSKTQLAYYATYTVLYSAVQVHVINPSKLNNECDWPHLPGRNDATFLKDLVMVSIRI